MNLNRAQYILTILEEGSISAAARRLFLSQAALSQTVRYVEEEVGLPILERGRGEVKLTYAGERYVETAHQMMLLERSFRNEIGEIKRELGGRFCFGLPLQSGQMILPRILSDFQKEYPAVRLKITEKGSPDLTGMIAQGTLDVALIRTAYCEKGMVYEKIQTEQLGFLAGKGSGIYDRYPSGTALFMEQAAGEPFVFMKVGHSSRFSQDKLLAERNLKLSVMVELDSFETAKQVVVNCGGVMLVSYSNLQRDEKVLEQAHFYPLKGVASEESTYLIYNEAAYLTPYMKRWMELVKSVYLGAGGR